MPLIDEDKMEETLLVIGDSFRGDNKKWLVGLLAVLIAAVPVYFALKVLFFNLAISGYQPPQLIGQVERSPLEVLEKEFVTIGENTYSGYIKLKNPNLDWGVPNLAYRVEIKTSSGSLITSTTNESFILPASEKYLVLPRFTTTFSPSEMDFTVLESKYVLKPENFPQLSLEMQRIQVSHEDNETIVSAVIKNNSPFTISQVDLLATLYTDRGELKVINYTNINDLVSGELRSFQIGWPGIVTGNLVAEISPEVNIFSKDILKTQGSVSPFDR